MRSVWSRAMVLTSAICAAGGCSGDGTTITAPSTTTRSSGGGTTATEPSTSTGPSTTSVPAVDRGDPTTVGKAFVEAWRVEDAARMKRLASSPDVVDRATAMTAEDGEVQCQLHGDRVAWQCNIGRSQTPQFLLLNQEPSWTVTHVGRSTGD